MPGLLSNVFADEADDGGAPQSSEAYDASGEVGIDLSPTVSLEHEAGGSYQNLDGSTTEWSSESDLSVTVDVDATLGAAGSYNSAENTE
jgi:hypothetical protein